MPRAPILPASSSDPTGVDRLERGAMREFDRRMRKIRDGYVAALDRIPAQPVVNEQYTYRLDQALLSVIFADTNLMVDEILQEGGSVTSGSSSPTSGLPTSAGLRRPTPTWRSSRRRIALAGSRWMCSSDPTPTARAWRCFALGSSRK